jgi:hypothetical protein
MGLNDDNGLNDTQELTPNNKKAKVKLGFKKKGGDDTDLLAAVGNRMKNAILLQMIKKQETDGKGLIDMDNPAEIADPDVTMAKRKKQLSAILQKKSFDDRKKYRDTLTEGKHLGIIPELDRPAPQEKEKESNCCTGLSEILWGRQEDDDEEEPEMPSGLTHLQNKHHHISYIQEAELNVYGGVNEDEAAS